MNTEDAIRIAELERENIELKKQRDYYKDRCGELEIAVEKIIEIVTGIAPF